MGQSAKALKNSHGFVKCLFQHLNLGFIICCQYRDSVFQVFGQSLALLGNRSPNVIRRRWLSIHSWSSASFLLAAQSGWRGQASEPNKHLLSRTGPWIAFIISIRLIFEGFLCISITWPIVLSRPRGPRRYIVRRWSVGSEPLNNSSRPSMPFAPFRQA